MRFILFTLLFAVMCAGCAQSYRYSTGMPADVANRFFFHIEKEAVDRGFQATRTDISLAVYARGSQLQYGINGDQIDVNILIPNKNGATSNYYRNKRQELERLNEDLIEGARIRARDAQDFAY